MYVLEAWVRPLGRLLPKYIESIQAHHYVRYFKAFLGKNIKYEAMCMPHNNRSRNI